MQKANFKLQSERGIGHFYFCTLHFSFCIGLLFVSLVAFWNALPVLAGQVDLEEEVRKIAADLRCVVCQNLSVADSPSETAQQMRALVREQLQQGKTAEEIKAYFVSKYGEWVLLAPTAKGFNLLIWVLPFAAVIVGIGLVVFTARRWSSKSRARPADSVDQQLIDRVKREAASPGAALADAADQGSEAPLSGERARLYAELRELDFDYQAGRLSETDYQELRARLETQAAAVLKEIDSSRPTVGVKEPQTPGIRPPKERQKEAARQSISLMDWRVVTGGIFLLLFGITLGVFLTQAIRPRSSDQDMITGDFLTGTGPGEVVAAKDLPSLLQMGRTAYERREWPKAIEAFKKALALDPNQPEAHTYMGLLLAQAGHAEGALAAFDRALSTSPDFALALWGKATLLYQAKEDFSGAREIFKRLLTILPPGDERNQIEKTIAEINERSKGKKPEAQKTKSEASPATPQQIRGTISVAPQLKSRPDAGSVLFIMAYAPGPAAGPPLAVKKIERPAFPLVYTLGTESVMMAGMPFAGKIVVSARLDKDGNPMTKEPGNLTGEYKKNPVDVGSQNVDIVLDRVM